MRFFAIAASVLMLGATVASADPIEDRQAVMKARGAQLRVLVPIAQEKQPFDAAAVMEALEVLAANAAATDIDVLWAPGTEGGKSSPKIWEDRAGFQAATDKFAADTAAAVEANPQDLASFQAAFGTVASNCGSCHEGYRL
ncbi:MAG: cytochrome c [Rhizobiaceae bacterium]|nr:cytochrome c [Rhizobiaceae bacterium]